MNFHSHIGENIDNQYFVNVNDNWKRWNDILSILSSKLKPVTSVEEQKRMELPGNILMDAPPHTTRGKSQRSQQVERTRYLYSMINHSGLVEYPHYQDLPTRLVREYWNQYQQFNSNNNKRKKETWKLLRKCNFQ